MAHEETHHSLAQAARSPSPELMAEFLCLGGIVVYQVQTEHEKVLKQPQHLFLVDGKQTDIGLGRNCTRVTLVVAKDGFLLDDVWRPHVLQH